jgi:hypothetical protein
MEADEVEWRPSAYAPVVHDGWFAVLATAICRRGGYGEDADRDDRSAA